MSLKTRIASKEWLMPEDLAELFEQEPEVGMELIQIFLTDANARLLDLEDACRAGRQDDIHRLAHRLRGSCNQFGAVTAIALLQEMELNPQHNLYEELKRELAGLQTAMEAWMEDRRTGRSW
jgi:HPt (histidine-containing phosphotransfer) domain-containing protein